MSRKYPGKKFSELIYIILFIGISFYLDEQFYIRRECSGGIVRGEFSAGRELSGEIFLWKKMGNFHKG